MKLNRKSAAKLASMTALGAGAVALTATPAEASIIVTQLSMKVGFDCGCSGYLSSATRALNATNLARTPYVFFRTRYAFVPAGTGTAPTPPRARLFVSGFGVGQGRLVPGTNTVTPTSHYVSQLFKFQLEQHSIGGIPQRFIQMVAAGAVWGGGSTGAGYFPVIERSIGYSSSPFTTTPSYSNFPATLDPTRRFALFSFADSGCGGGVCYGWMELQMAYHPHGPNVDIIRAAYNESGAFLPAGEVPEPSSFALTGLAALALGAKGVRRWRAARRS